MPEGRDVAADALGLAQDRVAQAARSGPGPVAVEEHRVRPSHGGRPARADLADRPEDERRVGLLHGLGLERDVGDLVEAAVEVYVRLRPGLLEDLDRSSVTEPRCSKSPPTAANSCGSQPLPTPTMRRPFESTSTVANW